MKKISHQIRDWKNVFERNLGGLLSSNLQILSNKLNMNRRIALVKQDVFQDLYCCPPFSTSSKKIIFSSLKRTGPVALFTKLKADFWIVKTEPDPECNIWQEKWFDCRQKPIEHYLELKTKPFLNGERGHSVPQGEYSVNVEEVDWGQYDIIISLDISIPVRLTRRHPATVWCYYISEPCMHSYRSSQKSPLRGYDLFLNQKYRHLRWLPGLLPHEIEFPYFLQYYGCFHNLCGIELGSIKRMGVFLESHTAQALTESQIRELEAFGPVRITAGKTSDIVQGLMESKYFLRLGGRKLWGNAMIEAIAAGCLAIGDPSEYKHTSLFTPMSQISNFDEAIRRIMDFESNSNLYERELQRQRTLLDYLCYARPLHDLFSKAWTVLNNRQALS